MHDLLALPSLRTTNFEATMVDVRITAEMVTPPTCPEHPLATSSRNGAEHDLQDVQDTPIHGKAVRLTIKRSQYRCSSCRKRLPSRGPDVDPTRPMTRRLVRYVENAILRRTATDIAMETGLSADQVGAIGTALAIRLKFVRFPTPDVLALDGIACSQTHKFQVATDARTGRMLAIFRGLDADTAVRNLPTLLNLTKVKVLVTDMATENIAIGGAMRGVLHVADKWHIVEKCNAAVRGVVADVAIRLKARGRIEDAKKLEAIKGTIGGKRSPAERRTTQFEFDLEQAPNAISRYKPIVAAYEARWQLMQFYASGDRQSAMGQLDAFRTRAAHCAITKRMAPVVSHINGHEEFVLNYFDSLEKQPDGSVWGPTTSLAERKNSDLKALWRASRGAGDDQFWLKAMFHPYHLDRHIVECGLCGTFDGPFQPGEVMERASRAAMLPQAMRCSRCQT
jgi:transposase